MRRKLLTTLLIFSLFCNNLHARINLEPLVAGDILKGIGTSVLADVLASTGGDLHAEGTLTDAGQTAYHVASGGLVGGLMGGSEGAMAAAAANLVADLTFKGLVPNKPTSLDSDEQKAYHEAIDRTAIAAKLFAPITVMFVTGGSANAVGTSILTSSATINENHMGIHSGLTEEEQQVVDEKIKKVAKKIGGAVIIGTEETLEFLKDHEDLVISGIAAAFYTSQGNDPNAFGKMQAFTRMRMALTRPSVSPKQLNSMKVSKRDGVGGSGGAGSSKLKPSVGQETRVKPSATKVPEKPSGSGEKVHKNSLQYVGDTHVYAIKRPGLGHKIGESAQGVRKLDGSSIRAEQQARRLHRETGQKHETKILRTFGSKKEAREYETRFIERYRRMFGEKTLPGNKTNR